MKTAYRASGTPLEFRALVRRLSTHVDVETGDVRYTKPSYRITDTRTTEANVDTVAKRYRETGPTRTVSLLRATDEGWERVGSLGTWPESEVLGRETSDVDEPDDEETAYDIYFESALSLHDANNLVRALDWNWRP